MGWHVWLMLLSARAFAAPEASPEPAPLTTPLPSTAPPSPLSYAVFGMVPVAGNSHSLDDDPGTWARFTPGLGARFELGWGKPSVRGAVVVSVYDALLHLPNVVPQYVAASLGVQVNPSVADFSGWELRIPVDAGLAISSRLPSVRAGFGVRVERSAVRVRPVFGLQAFGELGPQLNFNCLGDCASGYTGSGWQVALLAGAEIGGPRGLASPYVQHRE